MTENTHTLKLQKLILILRLTFGVYINVAWREQHQHFWYVQDVAEWFPMYNSKYVERYVNTIHRSKGYS